MADTKNKKVSIEVEVKTDKAKKQLDDFAKSVQSLKNKISLNVDIKTQGVNKTLSELQKNSEKVSKQMAQSFAGSFDQTAKKVKNVGKEIEKTLGKLAKEGNSIGAKFGASFALAAIKAIKAKIALFKAATKLIIKGMVATMKACLPMIEGGIRFLSNGITKALNGIATSAKKIIGGIANSLTNALKRTVEFTVNANVNANAQGDDSGNSGAGKSLLNAGLMAASLKTITKAAATNSLPKETGNVVAAFASKMIDAGQKVVTFGKFAYQAYTLIRANWPKIVETFKSISTAIKPYLQEGLKLATDAAKSVLTKGLDLAAKAFKAGIDKMMKSDNSFIRRLGEIINTISNKFLGLDKKTNSFRQRIEEATEKVKEFAHEIGLATTGKELKNLFTILVDSIKKVCKAFQPYLIDTLKSIVNFFNKVISAVGSVVKIFANLLSILSPLLTVVKRYFDAFAAIVNLLGGVLEVLNYFIEKVANIAKKAVALILKPFNKLDDIVIGSINKLADGIRKLPDIFDKLGSAAKRLASTFMDKVKDFFGIGNGNGKGSSSSKPVDLSGVKDVLYKSFDETRRNVSNGSADDIVAEFKKQYGFLSLDLEELVKDGDPSNSREDIKKAIRTNPLIQDMNFDSASDKIQMISKMTDTIIFCAQKYVDALNETTTATNEFTEELKSDPEQNNTTTESSTKPRKTFKFKKKQEDSGLGFNFDASKFKTNIQDLTEEELRIKEVKIDGATIDGEDIKVQGKPVEFDLDTKDSSETSLRGKIKSIDEAIQAYSKFENTVQAVAHPVKTLRQELMKKITFRTLEDLGEQAKKVQKDFNNLKESVRAFKAMEPGAEKKAASLKILGDSAKLAVDKLKIVLKANTVGKLIEKMKGPTDKATKKLADKVPGGKDNINLFKGALGKLALLFGGAGLFGMTKEATTQAIKYESAIMQLNNRLGQSAALMDKFAAGKGLDLGLSKSNIAEYGNIFSIYVSKFEADANKATETTIGLLEAASKTAQATGTDMTTVMDSFRSALTGSSEAVDQYGLNMKIANLELSESFKQIANGASKWEELTQAQQQQVIAMEMISQTNKNFGDGVKNSNSILLKFQAVLANVKLALGNTFKVIMTAVLPPLTALMQTLEVVLNKVTQFVTALLSLMGVQVDFSNSLGNMGSVTNGMGDASSSVDDIASSADNATDSAKKLKGELAGFDEINKITMSEETGSGEGLNSGGINAGEIQLETSNADNKIQEFANKAKEVLQSIMDAFKSGWDQNVPYIQKSLENLKLAFEHVKEASKDLFKGIWENGGQQLVTNIGALCSAVTGMAIDMAGQLAESLAQVLEHLNPANNEAMQYFIDSLNGMTKAAEEFVLSMGEHFASWREHGLQDFFNNIADIATALAGLAADLTGQILTALDTFFDHIDPANNPRTQKFLEALNYMAQAVEDFILSAGEWFSKFMESGGQAFLNNLGDIALAIGQLAATLVGDIINAIKDFMNSWVGEALITAVAKALEFLSGIVEDVVGFLADHTGIVETFLGVWGVYKGGSKVIEWANNLAVFIGGVKDLAIAVGSGVLTKLKTLFDLFKTSGLTGTIKNIALAMGDLVKNIITSTGALVKNIAQWALQKAAMVAGKVATVAMKVAQAALNLVMTANPIGLVVAAIAALVAAFVLAYNKCEWFREGVHKVLNWLKDAWNKYVEWFKGNCTKMWDGIKGVFDKIKNVFGSIKDVAKKAFSGVLDFITNPFKTAYNVVKGVVDKFKNIFNFKWSLPKIKLPHFSIKPTGWELGDLLKGSIPRLGIDWYSNGGIFNERALIGVGDANHGFGNNPEAVVPLDQMYKNINDIVKNQVNTALAQTHQAQGNTTVILRVNDVDLAKTVVKSINDLQRSTGEVLLDI